MMESPESRCQRNVECWLHEIGCSRAPVIMAGLLKPRRDRCYVSYSVGLEEKFELRLEGWNLGTNAKAHQPLGHSTAQQGWREPSWRWSAQVILHHDVGLAFLFFEVDFDGNNPNWGALPALLHVWDCVYHRFTGRKTSPHTVAKKRGWLVAQETLSG